MDEDTSDPVPAPEICLVLDAVDVDVVASFWANALGYRRVDRLGPFVVLVPSEGAAGPVFLVQAVPEAKPTKNRMHLDLHVAEPDAEARRLVELGATRLGEGTLGEIAWINMADPEGNEFDLGQR